MQNVLSHNAAQSTSRDVLAEVRNEDCNLAIWERSAMPNVAALLDQTADDVRFTAVLGAVEERLIDALDAAGFAQTPERAEFAADVVGLAQQYCSVMGIEELEVRVEIVTTNSCRKWHSDYVKARLITTYVGSGTDWLGSDDADRVKEGFEPVQIHSMSAGDVGIFKGKLATPSPAIHRSPPIAGTGETRLLVVLNPRAED